MYIAWGIPAVILGVLVFLRLPDWPREAFWLTPEERDALERELSREKEHHKQGHRHMTVLQALQHPQVLLLAAAYFFVVTASYGVEILPAQNPGELVRTAAKQISPGFCSSRPSVD